MTSFSLDSSLSLSGLATGIPTDSLRRRSISRRLNARFTSGGTGATKANNGVDQSSADQTLAAGGTVAIDLSAFTNLQGETAQAVTAVRVIYVEHVTGSLSSGISAFNAFAGQSFQGPVSAAATVTLKAGEDITLRSRTVTGFVVDGTHHNFYIVNNDGVNAATYRYLIAGS